MRPEPASKQTSLRQLALVLGDKAIGEALCLRLQQEGFETRLRPVPEPSSSVDTLKKLLREFSQEIPGAARLWIHPGVTPLAERSEWPTLSREHGFTFVGPPARSLSLFNNRLNLLGEGEKISIPNLLLSPDPLHSVREIEKLIRTNKFRLPCVLKAVRGGSGTGVRVIHQPEDLGKSLELWLQQIRRSMGEVIVLAERYLEGARRVVQPFVRLFDGHIELFPAIDASLTSRLRKIIEFCPAAEQDDELRQVRDWTEALAHRSGYVGVGSLEYLVDGTRAYLIEGVPRLNTSFCLWENVAGTSAVGWQLAAMEGPARRHFPPKQPQPERASGLALRLYAEDPILQLPQPGTIVEVGEKSEWSFPGSSAKLCLALDAPGELKPTDPSVVGYVWVTATDRNRAITVARGVLDEVWIAGTLQTNERFLHELLSHPWVQESVFHASFVDEEFIPSVRPDSALLQTVAKIGTLLSEGSPGLAHSKWAVGDQWIKPPVELEIEWVREPVYLDFEGKMGLSGAIKTETGRRHRVLCHPLSQERWLARVGNWFLPLRRVPPRSSAAPKLHLSSLVAGRIHSILYREGAWIPAHESALLIESLGMLVPHALPVDVRLVRWHVLPEDSVHAGQVLAEFERAAELR